MLLVKRGYVVLVQRAALEVRIAAHEYSRSTPLHGEIRYLAPGLYSLEVGCTPECS